MKERNSELNIYYEVCEDHCSRGYLKDIFREVVTKIQKHDTGRPLSLHEIGRKQSFFTESGTDLRHHFLP